MDVRVVDEAGRPVAGVPVTSYGSGPDNRREAAVDLRTDAEGRAAGHVGSGPRRLTANFWRSPGARPDLWMASKEFEARPGAELYIELVLPARNASLAVQVVDDLGAPIPGVPLSLRFAEQPSAETDAQGRAFFAQLPPHWARVDLEADDALRRKYGVPHAAAEHVELKAGQTGSARFVLPRTGSLRVVFEPEAGIEPKPVRVSVHARTNEYEQDLVSRLASLEEGLHLEGLAPQEYQVSFEPAGDAGFSTGPMRLVRVPPGDKAELRVPVREHAGVVSGLVLDTAGRPVEGVYLFVVIGDHRTGELEPRNTKSAADGSFRFESVPQAPIYLGVDPGPVRVRNFAHFGTFEDSGLRLQGPTEGLKIELHPGYAVRGTVRTASGRPVDRGTVYIDKKVFHGETSTNVEDGAFAFRNLRPGDYTIWYDSGGQDKQAERQVTVGPETGDADVELVVRIHR